MKPFVVPEQSRRAWVVTAPHQQPRFVGGERAPWGTRHVREDGAATTACGLPTTSWFSFWTLGFVAYDKESCPACAQAYARRTPVSR
ncbi:hypothetical protein [Nocardioides jejuensis]|uniref:Uncharacterized protein n=1 Tax=Nocardioides jejuensis TaxID=2502782 RepID=A0A4R1CIF7_9ACTN|nr:hypothetical protein [Nocardioides jejuensis]TCJ31019.1 hypothetical protein EPD65_00120 [Nocardioides jejuensis]